MNLTSVYCYRTLVGQHSSIDFSHDVIRYRIAGNFCGVKNSFNSEYGDFDGVKNFIACIPVNHTYVFVGENFVKTSLPTNILPHEN